MREGAKSRYYPIEFSEVLPEVRARPGHYAFVGIPCFVKAIRLLMQNDEVIRDRIKICIGLFCGHIKNAALVDSFALQSGTVSRAQLIEFRERCTFRSLRTSAEKSTNHGLGSVRPALARFVCAQT